MMPLSAHGLTVDLPRGFEGRIYLREQPETDYDSPESHVELAAFSPRRLVHPGRVGWAPERPRPVLHLANFALPKGRGDFGTGADEIMGSDHVFVSVLEYGESEVGTALFASAGMPLPRPGEFSPNALQRTLAGQAGWQRFFTVGGRSFCAYVVLGSARNAGRLCPHARSALSSVQVESSLL
jgi:hypothetical protein